MKSTTTFRLSAEDVELLRGLADRQHVDVERFEDDLRNNRVGEAVARAPLPSALVGIGAPRGPQQRQLSAARGRPMNQTPRPRPFVQQHLQRQQQFQPQQQQRPQLGQTMRSVQGQPREYEEFGGEYDGQEEEGGAFAEQEHEDGGEMEGDLRGADEFYDEEEEQRAAEARHLKEVHQRKLLIRHLKDISDSPKLAINLDRATNDEIREEIEHILSRRRRAAAADTACQAMCMIVKLAEMGNKNLIGGILPIQNLSLRLRKEVPKRFRPTMPQVLDILFPNGLHVSPLLQMGLAFAGVVAEHIDEGGYVEKRRPAPPKRNRIANGGGAAGEVYIPHPDEEEEEQGAGEDGAEDDDDAEDDNDDNVGVNDSPNGDDQNEELHDAVYGFGVDGHSGGEGMGSVLAKAANMFK